MVQPFESALLAALDLPCLLVVRDQIGQANPAAIALLGGHIVGEDVRIALRNPSAVALIRNPAGGRIRQEGLSVPGSIWEIIVTPIDDDARLITLNDLSVQASVARAHADFVANASHELRTPLAAILGYAETLSDPKAGGDPETRAKFLNIVKREAGRMQALIEDLMSLSRIEAIKHEAPSDRIDMVALAREAAGEAGEAAVAIDANVEKAIIAGDRGQMAQVLRNLVDNSIKYGNPGGAISIELEATPTGWVSLSVRDEGEGISPDHLPRLTERFYRADASRSREAGGTGLGLSIVKHIVERHRGRFDISSRIGEGTTVTLLFPLAGE